MAKSKDHREEFSDWVDLWDQACQQNLFPEQPKLNPLPESDYEYDDPTEDYYNNIDRMADEDGILHESSDDTPNPIMPDSRGRDTKTRTPWVDETTIEAVADLKRQLYEIECQLIAKEAGGKKWNQKPVMAENKTLSKKISTIKEKIDRLSDKLGLGLKESK